jgi:hypothetical protein
MKSNGKRQSVKNIFSNQSNGVFSETLDASVVQDKARNKSARIGTRQPAAVNHPIRAEQLNPNTTRSKIANVHKTALVQLTSWVNPRVKAGFQRIAEQEGLSLSAIIAAFLERDLQEHVDMHYSPQLKPVIEQAINTGMQRISSRLAWLLVRVAFDTGQTRSLVTNILGRQPGVTEEVLKNILAMSQRTAKGNITRKTPQIAELIAAVEKWLLAEERTP